MFVCLLRRVYGQNMICSVHHVLLLGVMDDVEFGGVLLLLQTSKRYEM
jgi:hypothetical protein